MLLTPAMCISAPKHQRGLEQGPLPQVSPDSCPWGPGALQGWLVCSTALGALASAGHSKAVSVQPRM